MYQAGQDELMFFEKHMAALSLYEAFAKKLFEIFPATSVRVQKTQISFSNRHIYACVSFARVKRKAELPVPYLVISLGLPYPLDSSRVAVKTEPYPGRWTTHFVVSSVSDLDDEFFAWVEQAYVFAEIK